MKREDIIRMAREASVEGDEIAIFTMPGLERFFQAAYAAGAAAERERNTKEFPVQFGSVKAFEDWCADIRRNEREACAKVCEGVVPHEDHGVLSGDVLHGHTLGCDDCAAAIRARGQA